MDKWLDTLFSGLRLRVILGVIVWTVIVGASLTWNLLATSQQVSRLAQKEARANFNKDQAFRFWATHHGGVYVPVTDNTPPNPHLAHVPERDITTPSGKHLTLMNPAYMLRQLMNDFGDLYGVRGRITSLKPLYEGNAPDDWERHALMEMEKGAEEVFEISERNGQSFLRLMRPMITREGCLKCHAFQGYKVGDVRGGVGVAVPMAPYYEWQDRTNRMLIGGHGGIWLLGFGAILFIGRVTRRFETGRLEAERTLKASEEKYRRLIEALRDDYIFYTHDVNGIFTYLSPSLRNVLGYSETEFMVHYSQYLTDSPINRQVKEHSEASIRGEQQPPYEVEIFHKDGSIRILEVSETPITDPHGSVVAVEGIAHDITVQRRARDDLNDTRIYLQSVLDSMPSALVGVDASANITHWNLEAARLSGVEADAALGRPFEAVLPKFSEQRAQVDLAINDAKSLHVRSAIHTAQGLSFFDIVVYPLITDSAHGAVIRIDDVTKRVRMQEVMMQTEKMMSVGGLAAGMAHELNNPIGGMLQGLQNIRRRLSPDLAKNREVASRYQLDLDAMQKYVSDRDIPRIADSIQDAGQRAGTIISNMLHFSRTGTEGREPREITALVDKALELARVDYNLKKKYDFKNVRIVRDYQPDLPAVNCIENEIQQVLLNILRNSAQALHRYRPDDEAIITIRISQEGKHVHIELEDNGPGVNEEISKRMFEPFFTTKPPGEGTGLGLSISYFIIKEQHGGDISVESTPGEGTRIVILLPAKE